MIYFEKTSVIMLVICAYTGNSKSLNLDFEKFLMNNSERQVY